MQKGDRRQKKAVSPLQAAHGKKGFFRPYEYVYDDCVLRPENQPLRYTRKSKEGYRHYVSNPIYAKTVPAESDVLDWQVSGNDLPMTR